MENGRITGYSPRLVDEMMKSIRCWICMLLCAAMLTGCSFISGGDDLLQAPKPQESYVRLQAQLEKIMGDKMTYVSPQSGSNRNTVTFEDIDADGEEEAIAFLREGTGGKIYVYAFDLVDDEYQSIGRIEGPGSALGSMSFMELGDTAGKLIVLTWTLSGDVKQGLMVCSVENGRLTNLLDTMYTSYTVSDLDDDGAEELFTVAYDDDAGRKTAQVYDYIDGEDYTEGKMMLLSQTDATQDVQSVVNITTGSLDTDGNQAVFVDNKFENDNGMQTDIYVLEKAKLRNIAVSATASTYRSIALYYSEDIDGDGIIEVPQLQPMPDYEDPTVAETLWMVDWYEYSMSGTTQLKQTTYDSMAEGWLLKFPQSWRGNVTVTASSAAGVSQTTFMETGSVDAPLLTIYVFTGDDREEAAAMGGLIDLGSTADICFAAKLGDGEGDLQITEKQLIHAFSIIQNEWT